MSFHAKQVYVVSEFLQEYMKKNDIDTMTADECAKLLAEEGILSNDIGPKPGFNFRQMLRDGRDGIIPCVKGARQSAPHKRWIIEKLANEEGDPQDAG